GIRDRTVTGVQTCALPISVDTDRETLAHDMTELALDSDPRVLAAGKVLYEAREAQNQAVSWVPEVMVMADSPKPRQTYVLNRGRSEERRVGKECESRG